MKKFMRKISAIVAVTVLATVISAGFGATAAEAGSLLTEGQEGLLRYLEIVKEDAPNYGKTLTRGELAHIAARVSNAPAYTGSEHYFYDVPESSEYFADVYALVATGVLSGDGDGYYRPNDPVADAEICKVFSVILGYKEAGEFVSYLRIANNIEITDGVTMDGTVTYAEALVMAFNTLHTEMFEAITYGDVNEYKKTQGYLAIERYHGLVKQEGIVEGMQYTNLIKPVGTISEGHIMINDRVFQWEDETLLGKYTVFYSAREDGSTSKEIAYIYADEARNNIVTLSGEDVIGIKDSELKYWVGGKERGYKLIFSPDVVINGVAYPGFTDADLQPASGTVTLIDNNDDNAYDVIVVDSVEYVVYDSRDKDNNILYGKYPEVTIGNKEQESDMVMSGPYGKINLGTLAEGTVLKIRRSKNTTGVLKVRMTEMNNGVTGQVTTFMNDKITVNGTDYLINQGTVIDEAVNVGETVTVYPDGDLAAVILHASNDNYQFAYLVAVANQGSAFSKDLKVKIVDKNQTMHELEATDPMWVDEIKTDVDAVPDRLLAANAMRVYNDDMKTTAEDRIDEEGRNDLDRMKQGDTDFPYSQPIRFKLNDEGKLTHIDTILYESSYELEDSLQPAETGKSEVRYMIYAYYPQTFYHSSANELAFTMRDVNSAMRIPELDRDEELSYQFTVNDAYYYAAEGFNVDPVTKIAKYAAIYDKTVSSVAAENRASVVADIYDTLNEDDEVVQMVEFLHPSASKTCVLAEELKGTLTIGDVVQYTTNSKNEVILVKKMFDFNLGKDQSPRVITSGSNGGYYHMYYRYRVSYGTLVDYDDPLLTHTTSVKEDADGVESYNDLQNYRNINTLVYVYSNTNGTPSVKRGSFKDLVPYRKDNDTDQKAVMVTNRGHLEYMLVIKEG